MLLEKIKRKNWCERRGSALYLLLKTPRWRFLISVFKKMWTRLLNWQRRALSQPLRLSSASVSHGALTRVKFPYWKVDTEAGSPATTKALCLDKEGPAAMTPVSGRLPLRGPRYFCFHVDEFDFLPHSKLHAGIQTVKLGARTCM